MLEVVLMILPHDWFPRPLPANVVLGERSWCYSSFAWLHYRSRRPCGVKVGHDSGIYNGTFFDLGPEGEVEIGNYCTVVGAIIATHGRVVIGDYTLIAHQVVLADSFAATPPHHTTAANPLTRPSGTLCPSEGERDGVKGCSIFLGENCWVAARAVLLAGAKIGADSIVAAGAIVDFEVPSGVIVAGNPARIVGDAR
jgi:acetyltransferase-like isoleucine patch superfamily enzyme